MERGKGLGVAWRLHRWAVSQSCRAWEAVWGLWRPDRGSGLPALAKVPEVRLEVALDGEHIRRATWRRKERVLLG